MELRFHAAAFDLAMRHGLLDRPEVEDRRRHLPDWFADLQQPDGRDTFQRALDVTIPDGLWEFWQLVPLVCLLDASGDLAYISHSLREGPVLWAWEGVDHLEFAMHGHSGECYLVAATGDPDPRVLHGFIDPEPAEEAGERLTAFIYSQVQAEITKPSYKQHRCYSYQVRLVPLPGGPQVELVEVTAYEGESVQRRAAERYPGRQVLEIRRHRRII